MADSVSDGTVPSSFTLNLSGSYDFAWAGFDKAQLFLTVNNVLKF